jgi:hypothetical protein
VSCVELTNAVESGVPFQFTVLTDSETKPAPVTLIGRAAVPATAVFGETALSAGTTGNKMLFEVPPAVVTWMGYEPARAMSLAGTATVRVVAVMFDGVNCAPLKLTVIGATKPVPVRVIVGLPNATADTGVEDVRTGTGGRTLPEIGAALTATACAAS